MDPSFCINTAIFYLFWVNTFVTILLLMKYLSLAGGLEGGEVQLIMNKSPTLYLPSLVGWVVSTGEEEGGWITVRSVLASTVLNLGASELTYMHNNQ